MTRDELYKAISSNGLLNSIRNGAMDGALGQSGGGGVEKFGWWNYENSGPDQSIPAGVWTTITNNALGPLTNTSFKPSDMGDILDPATGRIKTEELKSGDEIYVRHLINITPMSGTAECAFSHLSGLQGQIRIPTGTKMWLNEGAGVPTDFFLLDAHFYIKDEDERLSGMYPQVYMSNNATLEYKGCYISVNRR